jgi:anthranilate phosphoribosyltransferase
MSSAATAPAAKRAKANTKDRMKTLIDRLVAREDLSGADVAEATEAIAGGRVDPAQIAAFLVLLRAKGETSEEVAALVTVMRAHMHHVTVSERANPVLDIVGTGGDGHHTVNFSTAAAVLAAACGARVAKHGNRSVSSRSGSADVLEALGVVMLEPDKIAPCIDRAGIAFMFAPKFHPAMKWVAPVRRAVGVRTVFNILGPLLNPAGAKRMMLGVYSPDLLELYGNTVHALGAEHALIVHCCGLDELAPLGVADAVEVTPEGGVRRIQIDCTAGMGLAQCTIPDLAGGSCDDNAGILRGVFAGGDGATGPVADTIALNAGAGLYVMGMASSIKEGLDKAREVLRSGKCLETLETWAKTTQGF